MTRSLEWLSLDHALEGREPPGREQEGDLLDLFTS